MEAVWGRKFKDLLFLMKEIKKHSVSLPQGLCVAAVFVPGSLPAGNLRGGPLPGSGSQVRRRMPLFSSPSVAQITKYPYFSFGFSHLPPWPIMFCSPYTYVHQTKLKPRHPNPFHKLHRDDFEKTRGLCCFPDPQSNPVVVSNFFFLICNLILDFNCKSSV